MSVISFLTLVVGGGLLSLFTTYGYVGLGFTVLFMAASLCRAASAWTLLKVPDLPPHERGANPTGFLRFLRREATANFYRFLLFSGLMHGAVLVAGPFFVMYMIQDLHLSYWQYGAWMASGLVGQFMTFTAWGRFSDRFGNKALLTITGFLVPILPMLYLASTAWPFLMAVNYFGGVVWAGLSLGLQNYVFDAVAPSDRTKAVAVVSVVNALGWAAGTFFGSWLIGLVPAVLRLGSWTIEPVSNLPLIFFVSGALRLLVSVALVGRLEEPRDVERSDRRRLFWELPLVKPLGRLGWRRHALNR
jgi:MFS family permease